MPLSNRTFRFYVDSNRLSEMSNGNGAFSMMLHVPFIYRDKEEVKNEYVQEHEFIVNPKTKEKDRRLTLVDVKFKIVKD